MGLMERVGKKDERQEMATHEFETTERDIEQATFIAEQVGISEEDAIEAVKQAKKTEAYKEAMDQYEAPPEADIELDSSLNAKEEEVSEKIDEIMDDTQWYEHGKAEVNIDAELEDPVDELDDVDSLTKPSDFNKNFPDSVSIEGLTRAQDALQDDEYREALKNGKAVDLGNGMAIQASKSKHTDKDVLVLHFTDEKDSQSVEASDDPADFGIEDRPADKADVYIRKRDRDDPDFGPGRVNYAA